MSTYQIDFSEPLRSSFSIQAGGFNGPGGSAANSTLRLYGRGALEWGEAVDEDLLRLSENFASASPPSAAISGQIWIETKLYYHDTSKGNLAGWWVWDFTTKGWVKLGKTGVIAGVPPTNAASGQYYYGAGTSEGITTTGLWGYYSLGRYEPIAWVPRSFMAGSGDPSAALKPIQRMWLRDGTVSGTGRWVLPATNANDENPPEHPHVGMLWYKPSTGVLHVYSSNAELTDLQRWQEVLGPSKTGAASTTANGPINMRDPHTSVRYTITNVGNPSDAFDAANKGYVDSGDSALQASKVSKAGDTMTGALTVKARTTTDYLTVIHDTELQGNVNIGGTVNMNGNRITNVGNPTAPGDAATQQYVINQATTIAQTIVNGQQQQNNNNFPVVNPTGNYKAGDVSVVNNRVYIARGAGTGAAPGGNWVQVFPAVYS